MNFVDTGEYIIRVICIIFGIVLGFGLVVIKDLLKEDKENKSVIHAHWVPESGQNPFKCYCSNCRKYHYIGCMKYNSYCSDCGAKMDEEVEK